MAKAGRDFLGVGDNENVLLPVERPDVEGNPAWSHAMFNDGNGGEFRKTFHGCESLAQTFWRWKALDELTRPAVRQMRHHLRSWSSRRR